ncbi:hypothetical protein BU24DRAFT_469208 [Aaosphaeria arxii CBS 175.79]|uniref:Uncharacterized protein n=1 Tax=Aaosphaeria arxii CBS 175.79 TaxID=1450172 RepID=A0A6A5Y4K8_9PLEO|nr:uncharacterized protein BU24DRAFT_469208 [Aaosphaeria arxii CBS 175.79]KAF2020438.1 hypothetical protein BU24DRAFT_469208 [Aaosphaeria arxii CBS 175.79]
MKLSATFGLILGLAITNQTTCSPTDMQCVCTDEALNNAIQGCVMTSCTVKEGLNNNRLQAAVNVTSTRCGVPVRDRGTSLLVVAILSAVGAIIAVTIRTTVGLVQKTFGFDDIFALLAALFGVPVAIMQCNTPGLGFGRDTWTVKIENIYTVQKMVYASQCCYFLSSGFTKLTFLVFFLRIFADQRTHRICYVLIGCSVAYTLAFELTMIFACRPISAVWTAWDMESKVDYCIDQHTFYYVAASFNIAIDIAIILIPIPELRKLKLSLKRKCFLFSIFGVGGITIVVSCIRLESLAHFATSTNPMYDNLMSAVFSVLEVNVGIICICMPSFRRFLARIIPGCFGTTQADSDESGETPNARVSIAKRSGPKKRPTISGSLFDTAIMKTVDTKVETVKGSDDELRLVDISRDGKNMASSTTESAEGKFSMATGRNRSQETFSVP